MRRARTVVSGRLRLSLRLASVAVAIGGASLVATPAHASTTSPPINVPCSGANGGPASLIAAVNQTNQTGGGTIVLSAGCNYQLTSAAVTGTNGPDGLPPITTAVTVEGTDASISGNGFFGGTIDYRILEVTSSGNLTLAGLTIQGGFEPGYAGAGILNEGTTKLTGTTLQNNSATTEGGGMANSGNLSVVGSTISGNGPPLGGQPRRRSLQHGTSDRVPHQH